MMSYKENLQKCHEYIKALEDEKRKIEMFQRELPLCLEIVTTTIETCKQQLSGSAGESLNGQSECSERTASDGPAFEEFMPMKRSCSSAENGGENEEEDDDEFEFHENSGMKVDWLRSAQLWNQLPDLNAAKEDHQVIKPKRVPVVEVKTKVGAPQNTMAIPAPPPAPAASDCSTAERAAGSGCKAGKDGGPPQARKSRRCWSPELHRRFLNALEHLGGPHVATPKQIRDHMKVEGLTNDEVKSHLQKYRLHSSRPCQSLPKSANKQAHFTLVGGAWAPPPKYTTATTGPPPRQPCQCRCSSGKRASRQTAIAKAVLPVATHRKRLIPLAHSPLLPPINPTSVPDVVNDW